MKNHTLTKISAVTLILTFGTILTATAAIPQKTTKEVPPKINQLEKKFFSEIEEITNTKPSGKLTPQQLKQLKNLKSNTEKYIAEQNEEREALTANLDAIMFESPGSFRYNQRNSRKNTRSRPKTNSQTYRRNTRDRHYC